MASRPSQNARMAAGRSIASADSAFVAVRDRHGRYPLDVRLGLSDPGWPRVHIRAGRGAGGQVIVDMLARTSHDYLADPSITADYVPIMRREELRGLAVVPIPDLAADGADHDPAGLIYVSTRRPGAPGDRVVDELQRGPRWLPWGSRTYGVRTRRRTPTRPA